MTKVRKIIENSFYFLISNVVNFTLGFGSSIILARTLQPNNLGIFHQVQWFATMVSALLSLGFITCIIKFTAEYKAKGKYQDITSMARYIFYLELFICVVSSAVLILLRVPIADHYFSPKESKLFVIAFLAITPGMMTAIFSALLEGAQLFKYQGIHALTITPLSLITKITLMLNGFGVESLLWCNLVFSVFNLVFYFFSAKRERLVDNWRTVKPFGGREKKEVLSYNRSVFSIIMVDQIVWNRSENYFLGRFCQASQVAYFNLAQNLVLRFTGIIPNLMWKILLPVASEQEGENDIDRKKRTFYHAMRYSAFILFPLITICLVCAYEMIVVCYGQEYAKAEACFQILCMGALVTSLTQPGAAMIYAANKQRFIFWYGAILAVMNIILNMIFIPRFGAVGAAFCFTTITILGATGGFYYVTRYMNLRIPWISITKIIFSCNFLAFVLFLLIRQDTKYFDIFLSLREFIQHYTGLDFTPVLGPRVIRLLFSVVAGTLLYLLVSIILFSLSDDDKKIVAALSNYFPHAFTDLIFKWKQK